MTKNNTKCIKDLNLTPETIKLLKENIGENLHKIGLGNDMTTKAQATKAKIKWDYIKLKSFCATKVAINRVKGNLQNGRKYLPTISLIRG